jgi:hypothetical protein
MENLEKGYRGTNTYILADSQAAIKALDKIQISLGLPSVPGETGVT